MTAPTTTFASDTTPTTATSKRSLARFATPAARVLLGLVFFAVGLMFFLNLLPPPKGPMSPRMMAFAGGLAQSGYMMELIKGTEVLCGALLLANLFVPLALVVLAPVLVNIFAVHAFLEPSGLPLAIVLVVLAAYLGWAYRDSYRPLFVRRARPAGR